VPEAGAGRDGRGARGRRHAVVPDRRRARRRGAGLRDRDHPARGQNRRPRQPVRRGGQGVRRRHVRDRLLRGPDRDRDRGGCRARGVDCRRSHRTGRARSGRAIDPDHVEPHAGRARRPCGDRRRGRTRHRDTLNRRARRHRRHPHCGRGHRARQPDGARASRRRPGIVDTAAADRGRGVRRAVHRAGRRRLRHRIEPRAADSGRRAIPRRPERGRFRARHERAARDARQGQDSRRHAESVEVRL